MKKEKNKEEKEKASPWRGTGHDKERFRVQQPTESVFYLADISIY